MTSLHWFESLTPWLVAWTAGFTLLSGVRIVVSRHRRRGPLPQSGFLTELAGLPLTLLHGVLFVMAIAQRDAVGALLFAWWGPGFWLTGIYLITCRLIRRRPNWYPVRLVIAWMCKLNYVALMVAFVVAATPGLMFVYSAWIMNDQFGNAFLSLDADRLRRTRDDMWLVRILYPLGLLAPVLYPTMPGAPIYLAFGVALLALWGWGMAHLARRQLLDRRPGDQALLRNMVYLQKDAR